MVVEDESQKLKNYMRYAPCRFVSPLVRALELADIIPSLVSSLSSTSPGMPFAVKKTTGTYSST
jgi:hypothetical protein